MKDMAQNRIIKRKYVFLIYNYIGFYLYAFLIHERYQMMKKLLRMNWKSFVELFLLFFFFDI